VPGEIDRRRGRTRTDADFSMLCPADRCVGAVPGVRTRREIEPTDRSDGFVGRAECPRGTRCVSCCTGWCVEACVSGRAGGGWKDSAAHPPPERWVGGASYDVLVVLMRSAAPSGDGRGARPHPAVRRRREHRRPGRAGPPVRTASARPSREGRHPSWALPSRC